VRAASGLWAIYSTTTNPRILRPIARPPLPPRRHWTLLIVFTNSSPAPGTLMYRELSPFVSARSRVNSSPLAPNGGFAKVTETIWVFHIPLLSVDIISEGTSNVKTVRKIVSYRKMMKLKACFIVVHVREWRKGSIEEGNAPLYRRTNATSVITRNTGEETRTKPFGLRRVVASWRRALYDRRAARRHCLNIFLVSKEKKLFACELYNEMVVLQVSPCVCVDAHARVRDRVIVLAEDGKGCFQLGFFNRGSLTEWREYRSARNRSCG